MKIIFFGLGSIGKRHASLLKHHFNHELYAFRHKKGNKNDLGIEEVYSWKEVEDLNPDVAFITNPTSLHVKTAIKCAEMGIDLFMEKPLSNSYEGVPELEKIVKENNIKIYTAYCLRFHSVIKWLKEYLEDKEPLHINAACTSFLPEWRENSGKKSYSEFKDMGGGVILDLSHEIDYLYYLFGEMDILKASYAKMSDVTMDSEDFSDILFKFKKGFFANLHLNFLSYLKRREIIINCKYETIKGDFIDNSITIIREDDEEFIQFDEKKNDMYFKQLEYFFDNIESDNIMNGLKESLEIFEIIMRVKQEGKN